MRLAARDFLSSEAAGGVVLIAAAACGMLAANLPGISAQYFGLLHVPVGPLTVHQWVNDALMAVFFFVVGLEIKREFVGGELASWSQRRLPVVAALAGMSVPAVLYLALTARTPGLAAGWAAPAATDIAFAVGVMALLGDRVPARLKLFLTTVAIVDDVGAVAIIALAYGGGIQGVFLGASGVILGMLVLCNRRGVVVLWPYLVLSGVLWWCVLRSGVHPTIAGVAAAMTIPTGPMLERLEAALHPWSAFVVVPLFGFANAGVALAGLSPAILLAPLPFAIACALFLGKQVGILGSVWIADRTGFAPAPGGWRQTYGVALLAGIGFTMSLFIGGLAFPGDPRLGDQMKIGVLAGSLLSAIAGYVVLRFSPSADDSAAATSRD